MKARHPSARSSVILIREWEQQMSSSGCCGRLEGDFLSWDGTPCFPERRRIMERSGVLYRQVRERYGDEVELRVVDPRNFLSLLPLLFRDFRRYRVGLGAALHTLFGISVEAVVVDGRLLRRSSWPELQARLPAPH